MILQYLLLCTSIFFYFATFHLILSRFVSVFFSTISVLYFIYFCFLFFLGTTIARALAALPPNVLDPSTYSVDVIQEMARTYGWGFNEWTSLELKAQGEKKLNTSLKRNS